MEHIAANIANIRARIEKAAALSSRPASDITLVAVTKTVSPEAASKALEFGVTDLGENRVQELTAKKPLLPEANWHMIGHLQTNKVRQVVGQAVLIHSVDSLKLAKEIGRVSVLRQLETDILIEVNIGGEDSKFGVSPAEAADFTAECGKISGVSVKGLMCVAPIAENPDDNRGYFQQMRKLFEAIALKGIDGVEMKHLSMGMTDDFECAIECGATIVRVGTGIFGMRD